MQAAVNTFFFFLLLTVGLSLPLGGEEPSPESAAPVEKGVNAQTVPAASVVEETEYLAQSTEAAQITEKPIENEIDADAAEDKITEPAVSTVMVEPAVTKAESTQPENPKKPIENEIDADAAEDKITEPAVSTVMVEPAVTEAESTQPENPFKTAPTESQTDAVLVTDAPAATSNGAEPESPAAETAPIPIPDSQLDAQGKETNITETTSNVNDVQPMVTVETPAAPSESSVTLTNANDEANMADSTGNLDEAEISQTERTSVPQVISEVPVVGYVFDGVAPNEMSASEAELIDIKDTSDVVASEVDKANVQKETLPELPEIPIGLEVQHGAQPEFQEENQQLKQVEEELSETVEKPETAAVISSAISHFELQTCLLTVMLGVTRVILHTF